MTPEQWSRVKDIFNTAMERDADERRAFVAGAADGDDAVRVEVERLLDAEVASGGFIEQPVAATLLNGRVISHYEIIRLLGSGGMGRVYVARDTELGREVALKVASLDGANAQSRLRREAQHASRLSHPHICHIYNVGRADGQLFVVMELVPGRSLAEVVSEGPLSPTDARRYGMEIADALAHAHEHGVTHRDLKSTNVMITPARGAKVLDFGLARSLDTRQIDALSQSQRSLTDEGLIAGTLPYMAPELLRGQRGDQRSDIWALGVLLYEMVTGRRPFSGATGFEVSAAILHQPPDALASNVPAPMRAIIQRCLEKNPGLRYQDASDVRQALEEMTRRRFQLPQIRIPYIPRRLSRGIPLLVVGLVIAFAILYAIRESRVGNALTNVYAYSLLEDGALQQALDEFEALAKNAPNDVNAWDSLGEGYLANGVPVKALEAYSRALSINPRYAAKEALEEGRREDDDAEVNASALLSSAWMSIEQKQYPPALTDVGAAEKLLANRPRHSLLVLAELTGGMAEIGSGNVKNAESRLASQRTRYSSNNRMESNWVAALDGEIALARAQYDRAISRFKDAQAQAWSVLGRDASTVFAANLPSRDGIARVEIARGHRPAAIQEYRRLTVVGPDHRSSGVLEPRYVLNLARLLDKEGDKAGASAEYARFLQFWAHGDAGLPELIEAKQALNAGP